MKNKGKLALLIVITILLIGDAVFLFWAKNSYIKEITLSFSKSSDTIYNRNDIIDLELKDNDLKEVKSLIKKINYEECKCESGGEFTLNVDSKYSITFGKVGNDYLGFKKDFDTGKESGTFKIPKELYEKSTHLASKYKKKKDDTQSFGLLNDYKFIIDSSSKFKITTDEKYNTMLNDGGSHTDIYYNIDLDNHIYEKISNSFHANLGGSAKSENKVIYRKYINSEINEEVKNLLNNLKENEDVNDTNNYSPYELKSLNFNKSIYNEKSISELKTVLEKVDKFSKKEIFTLKSTTLKCPSPTLQVYDDGTFIYSDKYSEGPSPKVTYGVYDYDIEKFIENAYSTEIKEGEISSYEITLDNEKIYLNESDITNNFLNSLKIGTIHKCLEYYKN